MTATLERAEAVERGRLLRDAGILRASEKKEHNGQSELLRTELRFLDVLLAAGQGSADDVVDDLVTAHDDGGRWRGGIFLRLARQGLTTRLNPMRSSRTARHRGWQTLWAIADREGVERRRRDVKAMFDGLNANGTGSTGATAEPAIQTSHPSTKGSSGNGQVK